MSNPQHRMIFRRRPSEGFMDVLQPPPLCDFLAACAPQAADGLDLR